MTAPRTFSIWQQIWRLPVGGSRTVWLAHSSPDSVSQAEPLIAALQAANPRIDLSLIPHEASDRQAEVAALSAVQLLPPARGWLGVRRYLRDLDVRLVVALDAKAANSTLLDAASSRAIPVVQLRRPGETRIDAASLEIPLNDPQRQGGLPSERGPGPIDAEACEEAVKAIAPLLALDLKLERGRRSLLWGPLVRKLKQGLEQILSLGFLGKRLQRIETLEALRSALGRPGTVLCLGNGPSSEDPALEGCRYDALFRVNHLWLERGLFLEPDVVFCGSAATLGRVRGPIFAFQSRESEERLRLDLLQRALRGPLRYVTLERFSLFHFEPRWAGLRPTNGAAMLAAASALQPDRLIIAGIDLFAHPEGSYPGDKSTPNAYTPGHQADSELALLLEALDRYEGDLEIVSPALQAAWKQHQAGRAARAENS